MPRLGIGLILVTFCGCGGDASPKSSKPATPSGPAQETPAAAVPEKAEAHPVPETTAVDVDNTSPDAWSLQVDGGAKVVLPAYTISRVPVSPGRHTLKVMSGAGPVDEAEIDIGRGSTAVFNPKGIGSYLLLTVQYSDLMAGIEPDRKTFEGQRVVQGEWTSDFFGEELPETVFAGRGEKVIKSKLYKLAPKELPPGQALALLTVNANAYLPHEAKRAFKSLGGAPKSVEIRQALMNRAGSGRREMVEDACHSLVRYAGEIPEETLLKWLTEEPGGGSHQPPDCERVKGAAILLLAAGKASVLAEQLPKVPDINRMQIVAAVPETRGQTGAGLSTALECASIGVLLGLVRDHPGADDTAALLPGLEARIGAMPGEHQEKQRLTNFLLSVKSAVREKARAQGKPLAEAASGPGGGEASTRVPETGKEKGKGGASGSGSGAKAGKKPSGVAEGEKKAQAQLGLARNLAANGMRQKAIEAAEKVKQDYPDTEAAKKADALIEEWKGKE
ncbi:MAG: hypothetical protein HYU36_01460 [Planctomycetes bacterium]|nr:hypothetical protein [Planctomycetota bacterium]